MSTTPVTVIGLGPMGRAMAAALIRAGHPVTVWNRTASRADELVAQGATLAATPADAVAAGELIILSLTDYPAMYDILGPATDGLAGKTLANLSSDTPDASREAAAWTEKHGGAFLTGGAMVPPPMIGTPDAYVFYSGPRELLDEHEPVLKVIGEPRYVGADHGLAQLFYQAHLDVFLTSLSSLLHATALITSAGVPAADFLPGALKTLTAIPAMIGTGHELAESLEKGEHPGDLNTAIMMGATAEHIVRTSEAVGVDVGLPEAVKSQYDRAIAAGRGTENWTALYEVIKA
ncbi:3-hydroxyisobutyrate dehydrogenase-like beta-hydroxyacid dehydrogenase [Herbihabitans rhizosphaerae]|uniref:3-hydroxyisobutyrate dehydrogenase-like beta-hydroxyacid dehydrogenase n=1 Tax=Herbihabitans rhizosphaerae TaxID=1872711 RepID=A0A4Q7KKL7_9PSEU|nr:NAD(P)-binding domain-containing protein [Herbihabitans rhizosphaerae]RZS34466.1 3-hydroxyisobutyrate dehydrogenase-like beta-hydroxyacid dehydrogenase [Herbihabitans rhizosphaerae]